jgi:integrase
VSSSPRAATPDPFAPPVWRPLTLMEHAGVPISIVSKWAGHYDSAFTQKTYVHASGDDLHQGRAALAKIHKIA